MNALLPAGIVLASYLLGSIAFAVVVSKLMGLADPRSYGSGNPGATNVLRSGNKPAAVLTLLGDALKGFAAVLLARDLSQRFGLSESWVGAAAVAVFLGHLAPVFHRFKGGKGVATAAGVLFGLHWAIGLATLLTWIIIAFFFRYSSLAALIAALFAPLYFMFLFGTRAPAIALAIVAISALLIYRHRANIGRLLQGKEPRIGVKSPDGRSEHRSENRSN